MTVQSEPKNKSELPLNTPTQAIDLMLNFLGYRKRKTEPKSFSGLCCEEALMEAEKYAKAHRGKFVRDESKKHPCGTWSYCTLERNENDGFVVMWKKALLIRSGTPVNDIELELANYVEAK